MAAEPEPGALTRPAGDLEPVGLAVALAALAASGVALAVLPHAAAWVGQGSLNYVADGDQILYMAWSREALRRGVWHMADAVHRRPGPMMHPWPLFVPSALLAHALGLDVRGLEVLWRSVGGAGVALGLYAAVRPVTSGRRLALAAAALLLFDAGFLFGRPLLRGLEILAAVAARDGRYFDGVPMVMAHLRVVPPALALPFLLVHYAFVLRARRGGGRLDAVAAGLTFGALFYVYFYFWSAVLAGAALAAVLDARGRRLYVVVLGLGLAVGLPAVLAGSAVKASAPPDWLLRTDKFVPIGHFREWLVPKLPLGLWLVTAPWVFRGRRDLCYLWCCAGAGFCCLNQQLVTGLQIENYHWIMAAGPTLCLLLAALVLPPAFGPGPRWAARRLLLAALVAGQVTLGLGLRWAEATRTAQTHRWSRVIDGLREDGDPVPAGSVVAGDPDGVMASAALGEVYPLAGKFVEYCAGVTDAELDERLMLNLYLSGLTREAARREASRPAGTLSWEAAATRSEPLARAQRERRLALIDRVWADPAGPAARFGLTHVLLPASAASPGTALRAVGPTRQVFQRRHWQVWRVEPPAGLPDASGRLH